MKKILLIITLIPFLGFSQDTSKFVVNTGITFSMFQQQVKAEVGGVSGDRLVDNSEFGYLVSGQYKPTKWLGLGVYFRHDIGKRNSALFQSLDSTTNAAITINEVGGGYNEIWIGPMISGYYKHLSLDLGFGAFGSRKDEARIDLPNAGGSSAGNFTTHPSIAWMLAFGGIIPVTKNIAVTFKAEYRVRYYTKRNGQGFFSPIRDLRLVHGTQSFAPIIGVSYKF